MFVLLFLVASSSTFSYTGKDDAAFACAVRAVVQRPVAVLADPESSISAGSLLYDTKDDFRVKISRVFRLAPVSASGYGLARASWPSGFYHKQRSEKYLSNLMSDAPDSVLREGNVASIPARAGKVRSMSDFKRLVGGRLSWHPFFDEAKVTVCAENDPVASVLDAVAGAVGGTLVKRAPDDYFIDFDPSAFRSRAVELMKLPAKDGVDEWARLSDQADRDYMILLLQAMSDRQIYRAYNAGSSYLVVTYKPGGPVYAAALRRARVRYLGTDQAPAPESLSNVAALVRQIVDGEPVHARLNPQGVVECDYPVGKGKWLSL